MCIDLGGNKRDWGGESGKAARGDRERALGG